MSQPLFSDAGDFERKAVVAKKYRAYRERIRERALSSSTGSEGTDGDLTHWQNGRVAMVILRAPVTLHDHIEGPLNAEVTLVEYGDYECPHCGLAHPVVNAIRRRFVSRLSFVFRHFPLNQVHPNADAAAQTAEFAGAHDRFWQMHDGLYENQNRLGLPLFLALAGILDLSEAELRTALIDGTYEPKVRADLQGGVRSGVNGTPTFFINGVRHEGSYALEDLGGAIEAVLRAHAPL